MRVYIEIYVDDKDTTYCCIKLEKIFNSEYSLNEYIEILKIIKDNEIIKEFFFDKDLFKINHLANNLSFLAKRYSTKEEKEFYEKNKIPMSIGKAINIRSIEIK